MAKIVIMGGTGLIGTGVVERLAAAGHEAVAASPSSGVNTLTGEGVAEVLAGAGAVVDVTNAPSWEEQAVLDFFTTSTTTLLAAARQAGVGHYVALSVVGTDRLAASPYFRAKIAQEKLITESGQPYTIVRAAQFFEFVRGIADGATDGDTVRLPDASIRPIAAAEVSAAVADVAAGAPLNGVADVAGPETFHLDQLVRTALAAFGDPRTVVMDRTAPYSGAVLEPDTLVPVGSARLGAIRFADWLADRVPSETSR